VLPCPLQLVQFNIFQNVYYGGHVRTQDIMHGTGDTRHTAHIPAGHTGQDYKSRRTADPAIVLRSTINGQTMQIGLWISLYGFQSRLRRRRQTMRSATVHAESDLWRSALVRRINYIGAAVLALCSGAQSSSPSDTVHLTSQPGACFCPSSSTSHVTTYVTIGARRPIDNAVATSSRPPGTRL